MFDPPAPTQTLKFGNIGPGEYLDVGAPGTAGFGSDNRISMLFRGERTPHSLSFPTSGW